MVKRVKYGDWLLDEKDGHALIDKKININEIEIDLLMQRLIAPLVELKYGSMNWFS